MAYHLRDRKQRNSMYLIDSSSSSSGSESESNIHADPDFQTGSASRNSNAVQSRPSTRARRERKRARTGQDPQVGPASVETVRRRPGRPDKCTTSDETGSCSQRERRRRCREPRKERANSRESLTILGLLMEFKAVREDEKVYYWDEGSEKEGLEGRARRGGILCECCERVVTVGEFVRHAGGGTHQEEEAHKRVVLREKGYPLLGCQLLAWTKMFREKKWTLSSIYDATSATDTSDDACLVCADGGDLLCCDRCPLTYHSKCLALQEVPEDVWVCPGCVCIVCGRLGSEGQLIDQCTICEKAYHLQCGRPGFCGDSCAELDMKMKSLVGKKTMLRDGVSWTVIRHSPDIFSKSDEGRSSKLDEMILANSKIGLAWMLMDKSFMSIVDRLTEADLLRTVLYNNSSTFRRIDFKGFHAVILEKGDEMIAAASLRLRGKQLAEMPFISTSWSYRNQGMLKKLMAGIEAALKYLEVENLVLPSAEDVEDMWISKFGFELVDGGPMEKFISSSQMLMFPKSIKLVKSFISNNQEAKDENPGRFAESESKTPLLFDLNCEPPSEDADEEKRCV